MSHQEMSGNEYVVGWQSYLIKTVIMALMYFLAGRLTFSISDNYLDNLIVSIVVFLPEGISLAGAILFGRSIVPGVFVGQLLLALSMSMPMIPALGISFVNSTEAMIAITLFGYFKLNKALETVRDAVGLMLIVIFILQPFSSILGNLVLLQSSIITPEESIKSLFSWWFGNSIAQLLITPMLVHVYMNYKKIKLTGIFLTTLGFLLLNYIVLHVILVERLPILLSITLPPIILLLAYRNVAYAGLATTVIALSTIYATNSDLGAFATGASINDIIDLNFYLFAHIFLVLIIGTLFSEKKSNERLIIKKNNDLKELIRLREQVEYIHQHDLKNPLNIVVNTPYLIINNDPDLSENSKELLKISQASAYKMLDMVNRSLDMYKMETGKYELKPERVDIVSILKQIIYESDIAYKNFINENVTFIYDSEEIDNLCVLGESLLCYSLFHNLVRNAIEATGTGCVIIQITLSENRQDFLVAVTNEGVVPLDIRDTFFDKLVSRNKRHGNGVGTYSAKLCTEVQNGTISLDCSHEHKTSVIVSLPSTVNFNIVE